MRKWKEWRIVSENGGRSSMFNNTQSEQIFRSKRKALDWVDRITEKIIRVEVREIKPRGRR